MRSRRSPRPSSRQRARPPANPRARRPAAAHEQVEGQGAREDVVLVELRAPPPRAAASPQRPSVCRSRPPRRRSPTPAERRPMRRRPAWTCRRRTGLRAGAVPGADVQAARRAEPARHGRGSGRRGRALEDRRPSPVSRARGAPERRRRCTLSRRPRRGRAAPPAARRSPRP